MFMLFAVTYIKSGGCKQRCAKIYSCRYRYPYSCRITRSWRELFICFRCWFFHFPYSRSNETVRNISRSILCHHVVFTYKVNLIIHLWINQNMMGNFFFSIYIYIYMIEDVFLSFYSHNIISKIVSHRKARFLHCVLRLKYDVSR